jgi:hypothetical protein
MTFSKFIFCLLISLAFCFASCEYEPEAVNFEEVDPMGIQTIEIALDQVKDTLIVGTWTQVGFDLEFPKPVNFSMKVKLGTTTIYSAAAESGAFTISPFEFANGFYPLIFEIVSSTGTLSLADRLDVEKVLFEYQGKIVHVETSPAQKTNILSVIPKPDGLHITWPKYPKANFTQYILHKTVSPVVRGYSEFDQFVFTDIRQTSFVDADFVGGNAEYRLQVVTFTDMAFGDVSSIHVDPPNITHLKTTGLNTLEVGWPRSSFSTAFGSYHLLEDYTFGSHDYFTTSSISDTVTAISDFPFGTPVKAELRTQPKVFESDYAFSGTFSTFADIYLGDRIPDDIMVLEIKSDDRIYYYRGNYLYVMRHLETKPYDSLEIELNISEYAHNSPSAQSPDGQYLYVSSGPDIVRIDSETLDAVSSISLPGILTQANVFPFAIAVNNNNRMIVDVRQQVTKGGMPLPVFLSSYLAIINASNELLTDTIQNTSDVISLNTSENQDYVLLTTSYENKVFEISSGGIELRRTTISAGNITNALFTDSEMQILDNTTSSVYALTDFSLVSSAFHEEFHYRSMIDPLTGHLGVMTAEDEYSIYDPASMTLLNTIKVGRYPNSPDDFIQLMNNRLISRAGYRLTLP